MPDSAPPPDWAEVDSYLEAFEAACAREGGADLNDFLPPRGHPHYRAVLRELACIDLELSQARGRPRRPEEYCDRFPELAGDEDSLRALAEQARRGAAPAAAPAAPLPDWREQLAALHEDHRLQARDGATFVLGSVEHADFLLDLERRDPETARLLAGAAPPEPGADFLGFRLLRELGRGTFGRVYLAEQMGLANRKVALKVGERLVGESQTLAQLQHSNIVPIYSAHSAGPLQALCMPYLGSVTLADVLGEMRRQGGDGNALWSTLHGRADPTRPPGPASDGAAPARPAPAAPEALRGPSHVRAVLWVAARLADGLAHAHERGVVHRDVKPANVLLADDGTPLLLDFNLSDDPRLRGGLPALLGGTLPYMAPEHLEAFLGGTRPVDPRSDIYALGLVLYEVLAGRPAFAARAGALREQVPHMIADRRAGAPRLRPHNRAVTPAVEAIVRRCLEPDPACRYGSARQLQEDAQRHLDDLPLRHTPEPSRRERAAKFLRRHPRAAWAGAAFVLAAVLAVVVVLYVRQGARAERVDAVSTLQAFREEARDAHILLSLPTPDPAERAEGEELCSRALGRYGLPDDEGWEASGRVTALPAEERGALKAEVGELLLLLARATWLEAPGLSAGRRAEKIREALRFNDLAGGLCGAGERRAVLLQRAWLERQAGRDAEAAELLRRGREVPPGTARDYYLLAGEMGTRGEAREAVRLLDEAARRDPSSAAAWAARGACLSSMGRHDQAAAAFTTCVALRPGFWRGYLWRGRALYELREFAAAEADFDAALARRPGFAPALLARALARLGRNDLKGAEADVSAALAAAPDNTRLYFVRARVRRQAGDADGARRDSEEGLRREPSDVLSWVARGMAKLPGDAAGALADLDRALRLNPDARDAAQNKAHVLADLLGKHAEAIAVLDPVVERYPDFTEARIGRAVLHARLGRRKEALDDAAEALRRDPRPLVLYQAACAYALTSRQEPADRAEALRLLARALRGGFGAEHVERDPDLAPLRGAAEFRRLVEATRGPT